MLNQKFSSTYNRLDKRVKSIKTELNKSFDDIRVLNSSPNMQKQ